jgi:hypothetical protein
LERESEKCDGKTGKINNEDPGLTEMIKDNEDRKDAEELKHDDDKNQIVTAEMTEPQSVNNNRLKETEWLQTPDTGNNASKSTKELLELWMEYVYSTRMQEGLYDWLPELGRGRCYCGKSRTSFPHWPPTSLEEAEAQFQKCFEERNTHRKYLAHCWWIFINNFANMEPWTVSEPQQRYKDGQEEIRRRCPAVAEELDNDTKLKLPKRPRGWRCDEYCEPTLKERRCSCLCHCEQHRDQCPIHSY